MNQSTTLTFPGPAGPAVVTAGTEESSPGQVAVTVRRGGLEVAFLAAYDDLAYLVLALAEVIGAATLNDKAAKARRIEAQEQARQ